MVNVKAGGSSLTRLVQSGTIPQDDMRRHFAVGAAERVDSLEVRWPDGSLTRLENVKANRRVVVEQER